MIEVIALYFVIQKKNLLSKENFVMVVNMGDFCMSILLWKEFDGLEIFVIIKNWNITLGKVK